jgi:hypothetical protein
MNADAQQAEPEAAERAKAATEAVLALAQKLHDEYVAEGLNTRERLISEGQSRHDQIVREATARQEELASTGQAKYDEFVSAGKAKPGSSVNTPHTSTTPAQSSLATCTRPDKRVQSLAELDPPAALDAARRRVGPSADDQNRVDHRPAKGDRRQISNLVAVRGRMHHAAQVSGRGSPDRGCAGVHGCCRLSLVSGQ